MRKRPLIDRLALLFVFATVLVITLFAVFEDALFFHSDARSVVVVSTAFGLGLAVVLALVGLCIAPIARARAAGDALLGLGIPALVVGAIALFILDLLQGEFKIFGFLKGGWDEVINVGLSLACLVWVGRRLARHRGRAAIEARVTRLARVAAPALLAALVVLVVQGRATKGGGGPPRHVVVVVLDGWPAEALHTYNPAVPPRGVDSLFAQGRVYRDMHTNATWTHGYFGALYLGTTASTFRGRAPLRHAGGDGDESGWNVWSGLQRLGVTTRWIVFHQNGVPENRALSVYGGFRSIHLTHRYAPLLRALGLDYHLIMCGPASRKMAASPRRRAAFNPLNAGADVEDAFADVLLPELRALHADADRSFLLFHTGWTAGTVSLPPAWETSAPRTERERLAAEIKKNDNRYDADAEWYAAELRAKTAQYTDVLGGRIERFLAAARAEGLLENTILILTADHGHMFDHGRFWYGFHPDEEVTRVPMVVFGADEPGVDDVPRETIDITRTIVEYLGGAERPDPRAVSLFEPGDRAWTVTATLRSPVHHEWFVVLYTRERKYVCNVDPGSDGGCEERDRASRALLASGPGVADAIRPRLGRALRDFGFAAADIHPLYRELLAGADEGGPAGAAQ
jgi:hypothetical protein